MELENTATKKRYVFRCGRWLAKNEDDGSTVRELPAEGDDIKKPQPGHQSISLFVLLQCGPKPHHYTSSRVLCDHSRSVMCDTVY